MNTTIFLLITIGIVVLLLIILISMMVIFNKRLNLFTKGSNGASLESTMKELIQDHNTAAMNHEKLSAFVDELNRRVTSSHRGFALAKYNAFEHVGGNQSFSAAILDENGNGMVLSGLYSRERSNVFAKPISQFSSELELTDEEKKVLKQATAKLK